MLPRVLIINGLKLIIFVVRESLTFTLRDLSGSDITEILIPLVQNIRLYDENRERVVVGVERFLWEFFIHNKKRCSPLILTKLGGFVEKPKIFYVYLLYR